MHSGIQNFCWKYEGVKIFGSPKRMLWDNVIENNNYVLKVNGWLYLFLSRLA